MKIQVKFAIFVAVLLCRSVFATHDLEPVSAEKPRTRPSLVPSMGLELLPGLLPLSAEGARERSPAVVTENLSRFFRRPPAFPLPPIRIPRRSDLVPFSPGGSVSTGIVGSGGNASLESARSSECDGSLHESLQGAVFPREGIGGDEGSISSRSRGFSACSLLEGKLPTRGCSDENASLESARSSECDGSLHESLQGAVFPREGAGGDEGSISSRSRGFSAGSLLEGELPTRGCSDGSASLESARSSESDDSLRNPLLATLDGIATLFPGSTGSREGVDDCTTLPAGSCGYSRASHSEFSMYSPKDLEDTLVSQMLTAQGHAEGAFSPKQCAGRVRSASLTFGSTPGDACNLPGFPQRILDGSLRDGPLRPSIPARAVSGGNR